MISLGEMIAFLPIPGGHIKLAERFVNPALSFAMGWNYWYTWMIALPGELSATATLMHYWVDKKYDPLWVIICFFVVLGINLLGSGMGQSITGCRCV
jgi:amino acid permease